MAALLGAASATAAAVTVPAGALSPGHSYLFTCCSPACAAASRAGSASLRVLTASYPSAGTATVAYDANYPAPHTEFTITM